MKKLIFVFVLLFLIIFASAVSLNDIDEQEFIFKGINKDNVFTELISNKADIASGEAIFLIDNPFKELDLNKTLFFDWYLAKGVNYNYYDFYIGEIKTEKKIIPIYENVNYTCYEYDNITKEIIEDICIMSVENGSIIEKTEHLVWTKNTIIPKGSHMIKFIATWDAHLGPQESDWFPEMHFDMDEFNLPDYISFRKSIWAWFNTSWDYNKEYTNLTGNITYMYFNKSVNDNADFNDTRFISCYNDSLVFNHTLEAEIGTYAQFRVNNLGENCTLRYYGNSEATSTSNASDVYFEPVSAWYFDANADDFVGSNDGTVTGATLTAGAINGSYSFASSQYVTIPDSASLDITNKQSWSLWVKRTDGVSTIRLPSKRQATEQAGAYALALLGATGQIQLVLYSGSASSQYSRTINGITDTDWHHITITFDDSTHTTHIYIDGVDESLSNTITSNNLAATTHPLYIGFSGQSPEYSVGRIDEVRVYDYALSPDQVYKLYTETAPNFIEGNETSGKVDNSPTVNLSTPANNTNFSTSSITFNGTAYDDINLINVTLYIDGVANETNSSGINNSNYIFTKTLGQGSHNWTYKACDNSSQCTTASYRYFEIDVIAPTINITYPTNGTAYDYLVNEINLTINNSNLDTCLYTFNNFVTNYTFNCSDTNLNITGNTSEGLNYLLVFANDTFGNENISSVNFTIDLTTPIINIIYPEAIEYDENITTLNYTLTDNNPDFCWYSLDNGTTNISIASPGQNVTEIISNNGYNTWTIYCNDTASRLGLDKVTFLILEINLTLNGLNQNLTSELNTSINISAILNVGNTSIDIYHPDYGINYITELLNTSFQFFVNYFRNTLFSDSNSSKTFSNNGTVNNTIYFSAHQYDEIDSMGFNLTGINNSGYPELITIYKSNTSLIDRIFPGYLIGNLINLYQLNTGELNTSLFFSSLAQQSIEFFMDDGATFNQFTFNISGEEYGFEYSDGFDDSSVLDPISNEGMFRGAFGLPKGTDLKSFIYDPFITNTTLDSLLWGSIPNGNHYVCDGIYPSPCGTDEQYLITIDNYYDGGLIIDTLMTADVTDNRMTATATTSALSNLTKLNIWTAQELDFKIEYENSALREKSQELCSINPNAQLGGKTIWSAPWQICEDSGLSDCNMGSETLSPLIFHMERMYNKSWNVSITGVERTFGDDIENGECGSYNYVYNYTNGSLSKTYQIQGGLCSLVDSVTPLDNTLIVSDIDYVYDQLRFNVNLVGRYDDIDGDEGCDNMDSFVNISLVNQSLYNMSNSSIISNSIFDSSGDISSATLLVYKCQNCAGQAGSITNYLSANDGDNWEEVDFNVSHSFTFLGKNMKYRYDFNLSEEGYITNSPFLINMSITIPKGFPTNLTFDFGDDGIIDAHYTGELNTSNSPVTINISTANISSAFTGYSPYNHLFEVPLTITSATVGEVFLDNFNLTYNPNPIIINKTSIYNFLINSINHVLFSIKIESDNGNLTVNDIRYDYAGGNDTIEILAHNQDYSINESLDVIYHYSRWDYEWIPAGVEWIYFAPTKPTAKNVTPYGQSSTVPILNITNYGYGGENATLSVYIDGNNSCVDSFISIDSNKSEPFEYNESCYQETSTIATSCGGLSTGAYSFSDARNDGSWATNVDIDGWYYINYTIPENAFNATWKIKTSSGTVEPSLEQCLNGQDTLELKFLSDNTFGVWMSYWYCYNTTDWNLLYTATFNGHYISEEAINWSITKTDYADKLQYNTWIELDNLEYLTATNIWMWADYNCSYNTWHLFEPNYYFRQCVVGGTCSTKLI